MKLNEKKIELAMLLGMAISVFCAGFCGFASDYKDITDTVIITADGRQIALSEYGLSGYLDIGLIDTMKDLLVNFVGAVVFSIIGYLYIKSRGRRNKFAKKFIPTVDDTVLSADGEVGVSDNIE